MRRSTPQSYLIRQSRGKSDPVLLQEAFLVHSNGGYNLGGSTVLARRLGGNADVAYIEDSYSVGHV